MKASQDRFRDKAIAEIRGTDPVCVRLLDVSDAGKVAELHRTVRHGAMRGALDPRSLRTFERLLADAATVAVGAEAAGRLVAYAIHAVPEKAYIHAREFLRRFDAQNERVAESRGLAVAPEFRRRGIAKALVARQMQMLQEAGISHAFNTVLAQNEPGVIVRLSAGSCFVSHFVDRFGRCFLAYAGPLQAKFGPPADSAVPLADIATQRQLFAKGHAATACFRPTDRAPIRLKFSAPRDGAA